MLVVGWSESLAQPPRATAAMAGSWTEVVVAVEALDPEVALVRGQREEVVHHNQ